MRNWKGNIRELSHYIEQAVIMSEAETLDFSSILTSRKEIAKPAASTAGLMSMTDFEEEIKVMERKFILEALGLQEQGSNHRKRRWSKALVVSFTEKAS